MDAETERAAIRSLLGGQFVCKYMSADTAISRVLRDGTVRLSPFEEMNDPRETDVDRFECEDFVGDTCPSDNGDVARSFGRAFASQAAVFSATRDNCEHDRDTLMLRGFGKPRMWAQYGQNHGGVCLVFDRTLLAKNVRDKLDGNTVWSEAVDYCPQMLEAGAGAFHVNYYETRRSLSSYLVEHCHKWHLSMLFRKHEDWSAEREWRIATINQTGKCCLVEHGDALKYVVLGNGTNFYITEAVRSLTHLPVLRLRYQQWKEDFVLNITASM